MSRKYERIGNLKICKVGHQFPEKHRICPDCHRIKERERYRKNREDNARKKREWRALNRELDRQQGKDRYEKDSTKKKQQNNKWHKNNRGKVNAKETKRKAKKLNATPPWLTKEQLKEMQDLYVLAKEIQWLSEEPLHVDHIVPLQGESVSGLHVPWNLQILPATENIRKHNKLPKRGNKHGK